MGTHICSVLSLFNYPVMCPESTFTLMQIQETVSMKYQTQFSEKNKKIIFQNAIYSVVSDQTA